MKNIHRKQNTKSGNLFVMPGFKQATKNVNQTPSNKRKPKIRSLFILIFSLWALYTFIFVLLPSKTRMNDEHRQLQKDLSALQQEEHRLTGELNDLQDEQYIARLARKFYNMIKPGEIPYRPGE